MKTLAGRVFAILLLATVLIQVLSFGGVLAFSGKTMRGQMYDFLATDLAFIQRFLGGLEPEAREEWMPGLSRGYYTLELLPASRVFEDFEHPLLLPVADVVRDALATQTGVQPVLVDSDPGLVITLDASHAVLVRLPVRPPFSPPPLAVVGGYVAFVTLCVMLAAWFAVRLTTRPLGRFAAASQRLASDLDAPPLSEHGPSEVAHASRAFNAMQIALQKNLRERTRILASISHDLKTPLTRLRLRVAALSPAHERDRAEADIDAMDALVQEGLDYARSERVEEARVPSDLNAMVDTLAEQAEDLGHAVTLHGRLVAPVTCAPRAIQRALQNLVDNALKYGGEVEIELSQDDRGATIRIQDRGPGIPEALLERVFEPFYRIEDSRNRQTGGTGLGLSIARNLVHGQGGRLRLENRDGGGLAAVVFLPRCAG